METFCTTPKITASTNWTFGMISILHLLSIHFVQSLQHWQGRLFLHVNMQHTIYYCIPTTAGSGAVAWLGRSISPSKLIVNFAKHPLIAHADEQTTEKKNKNIDV